MTIEVNTTPGLARQHLPKMIRAQGLSVEDVINGIVAEILG